MVHSINMNSWRFLQISQRNSLLAVREILFKSSSVAQKFGAGPVWLAALLTAQFYSLPRSS
jgi:hypothetical protein